MYKLLVISLFCMFYLNVALVQTDNVSERLEFRDRLILDNIIPSTEKTTNVIDCYRSCKKTKTCNSISYHVEQSTCHLYSSFNIDEKGNVQNGWMYFSKDITEYCPLSAGYVYKTRVNLCFKLFKIEYNNAYATATCASDGAALLRIDSEEKRNAVVSYLTNEQTGVNQYVYIQGKRVGNSTTWVLNDGEKMTYLPWNVHFYRSQPDDEIYPGQDSLAMNTFDNGLWHDVPPSFVIMFICEKRLH